MLKKLSVGFVVLVIVAFGVVMMQPAQFSVTRTTRISAPAAAVFPLVNDFHHWGEWSPWEKIDPSMKRTYDGPASGVGAVYRWVGNGDVGEGSMTITESKPNEQVLIQLEFLKPMPGVCPTTFTFKPEGDETQVTWTMSGTHNFLGKAMCLFMNMDEMIGGEFEKGLAAMNQAAQAKGK